MLTKPSVPYDICVADPISHWETVGAFSVITNLRMELFEALLCSYSVLNTRCVSTLCVLQLWLCFGSLLWPWVYDGHHLLSLCYEAKQGNISGNTLTEVYETDFSMTETYLYLSAIWPDQKAKCKMTLICLNFWMKSRGSDWLLTFTVFISSQGFSILRHKSEVHLVWVCNLCNGQCPISGDLGRVPGGWVVGTVTVRPQMPRHPPTNLRPDEVQCHDRGDITLDTRVLGVLVLHQR